MNEPAAALAPRSPALPRAATLRDAFNLPNLITLARLLAVPLAIWLILYGHYAPAFWVFIGAGISDALDGYIAKRFDSRTPLGALLDPVADKALLAGVYVTLGLAELLPHWLVILVVLRDALIVGGFVAIHTAGSPRAFERLDVSPLYSSKINTSVQIVLVGYVLARLGVGAEDGPVTLFLIAAAAATTVWSGLSYLVRWARLLGRSEPAL